MHDRLTWRASLPRGCNVALRPRGRATGGPHGAQEAHKGHGHVAGGHAITRSTWAPV